MAQVEAQANTVDKAQTKLPDKLKQFGKDWLPIFSIVALIIAAYFAGIDRVNANTDKHFDHLKENFDDLKESLKAVDTRLDGISERVARIEERLDDTNNRLDDTNNRLGRLEDRLDRAIENKQRE